MNETAVSKLIQAEASRLGARLWRNNNGACKDDTGRQIRFGLGNESKRVSDVFKSSDLIGATREGRFLAVEVKRPGWKWSNTPRERAQLAYIQVVQRQGGLGGFATCVEDLHRILTGG